MLTDGRISGWMNGWKLARLSQLEAQVGQKLLTWIRLIMIMLHCAIGGHLGYQTRLPSAIQNLPYHSGADDV